MRYQVHRHHALRRLLPKDVVVATRSLSDLHKGRTDFVAPGGLENAAAEDDQYGDKSSDDLLEGAAAYGPAPS
jgi:hypothetical protein